MRIHYSGPSGEWDSRWPKGSPLGEEVIVEATGTRPRTRYKLAGVQDGVAFYTESVDPA